MLMNPSFPPMPKLNLLFPSFSGIDQHLLFSELSPNYITPMAIPFLRRLLLPFIALVMVSLLLRSPRYKVSNIRPHYETPGPTLSSLEVSLPRIQPSHRLPAQYTSEIKPLNGEGATAEVLEIPNLPVDDPRVPALIQLTQCPIKPNRFTNHIRLPNMLYNISMSPEKHLTDDKRRYWNPTIIALPSWAENE